MKWRNSILRYVWSINAGPFKLSVDPLLPFILLIIAWLLSYNYYPEIRPYQMESIYLILGVVSALLLAFSIFLHELGHAMMGHYFNLGIDRIHLFAFGGMALLRKRPLEPIHELFVALGGPLLSLSIAAVLALTSYLLGVWELFLMRDVGLLLTYSNILLGVFNLFPIFPLDGGRALRAILWKLKKKYYRASLYAYKTGALLIAMLFLAAGISFFYSGPATTFWLALVAIYLSYTALRGKHELIYLPNIENLIWYIDKKASPAKIIDNVVRNYPQRIRELIIPVLLKDRLSYIIYGWEVIDQLRYSPEQFKINQYLKPPSTGTYIDTNDSSTFSKQIEYIAHWVPVVQNMTFLGVCDAEEMRFWLLEMAQRKGIPDLITKQNARSNVN